MSDSPTKTPAQTGKRVFFLPGDRIERRARLQGSWLNIFDITMPAGGSTPPHAHASPEVFRILEGRLKIWRMTDRGPEEIEASAGDIVSIAAHQPHGYSNPGPGAAVFSAIVDNAMAEYFEEIETGELASSQPSGETLSRIQAVANAYGIKILAA